jgi:hypothetical protein
MTAKEIASGVLAAANITDAYQAQGNAPNAVDLHEAAGCQIWTFGLACIAKCLQLVRTAESFAAPASIMGSNFVAANSDSPAVRLQSGPHSLVTA